MDSAAASRRPGARGLGASRGEDRQIAVRLVDPAQDELSSRVLRLGHIEQHFGSRAGRRWNGAPHRLESVAGLAVHGDHERLDILEADEHDSRIGEIGEAQANARAGRKIAARRRRRAVHGDERSDAPCPGRGGGRGEIAFDHAVLGQPPIVEDEQQIGVGVQRLRLVDDEKPLQAAAAELRRRPENRGAIAEEAGVERLAR